MKLNIYKMKMGPEKGPLFESKEKRQVRIPQMK
jgi:hypothetical protein